MGLALRRIAGIVVAAAWLVAMPLPPVRAQELSEPSGQRDAVEVGRRQAEFREAVNRHGETDPRILGPLVRLGYALLDASRYEEAEQLFKRQTAIVQANYPPQHIEASHPLHHLGETYRRMGRCAQGEPLLRQALEMRERLVGPQHENVGRSAMSLAQCLSALGRFQEAETLFRRALSLAEQLKGPDSPEAATVSIGFAEFYVGLFRFADAEPLLKKALAIRERVLGSNHRSVATILIPLARVYRWTERYREAEETVKRALVIREQTYGPDHEFVAYTTLELGVLYMVMGRYPDSEQLKRRTLSIFERVFGPEHRQTGDALASLAETYYHQGRYPEAADLFRRSIAVIEKAVGPMHRMLVFPLRMLGQSERRMGHLDEALPYMRRALAVAEAVYGPDNQRTGQMASTLSRTLIDARRDAEAEPLLYRALAISEKTLGADSAAFAFNTVDLARLKLRQGQYADAQALAERGVENLARVRGAEDFEVAWARTTLAAVLENQNRFDPALVQLRQATASFQGQMDRSRADRGTSGLAEQASYRSAFMDHVFLLWRAQAADSARSRELTAEAFEIVQLAQATGTEAAVARMAARFASGTDQLAETVRSREDALERWRAKDASLVQLLGRPRSERDPKQEAALRTELRELEGRLKEVETRIAQDFPDYAALASPRPAPLSEIQALLRPDEAMILWFVGTRRSLIMAVRRDRTLFARVDVGRAELNQAVRDLRKGLDPSEVTSISEIPRFDTSKAYALYNQIFAPIAPALDGARHVFLIPDAGLQSLPLGVLVTAAPSGAVTGMSGYRDVNWLAKRYATTVLPSVSSLKSLRRFARTARASSPFIGVGDPTLDGAPGATRGVDLGKLYSRGAVAKCRRVAQAAAAARDRGRTAGDRQDAGCRGQ